MYAVTFLAGKLKDDGAFQPDLFTSHPSLWNLVSSLEYKMRIELIEQKLASYIHSKIFSTTSMLMYWNNGCNIAIVWPFSNNSKHYQISNSVTVFRQDYWFVLLSCVQSQKTNYILDCI